PVITTLGLRPGGQTFTIELDAGDVYQMQAQWDLSGTHIKALGDRRIAVFAGAVAAEVECGPNNHIYHQNLPVKRWGHEYIAVPYFAQNMDRIKVVALSDNTEMRVDCGSPIAMARGEVWDGEITGTTRITANGHIAVAQYNRGQACNGYGLGDPSHAVLVPTALHTNYALFRHTKFLTQTDGSTPSGIGEYFINLLGTPGARTLLNGLDISDDFHAGPAQRTWAQIPLPKTDGNYAVYSTLPFAGVAYAYSDMDTYSYHVGYNCDGCLQDLDLLPDCP
ncbi:MAG: IgGFc-binding protein, partial [Bradymonadaceae bacterium]